MCTVGVTLRIPVKGIRIFAGSALAVRLMHVTTDLINFFGAELFLELVYGVAGLTHEAA
jgi:hypothetical protein